MTLISDLPSANSIDGNSDVFPIVNNALNTTQKINRNIFLGVSGDPVDNSTAQTLSNKTLTAPAINNPVINGTVTGTYTLSGTVTLPSTVVTKTGVETLTNKTLTSPTINTPNINNATITADAVNGFTSANNGTIYGVSVISGEIDGSSLINLSVGSAQLTGGAVTYSKLANDSSYIWQTWTPTWTNVTGTTTYARYSQIGKVVNFSLRLVVTAVSGIIYFTLPVNANSNMQLGDVLHSTTLLIDTGTNVYLGYCTWNGIDTIKITPIWASDPYARFSGNTSATVPFTWASGDVISVSGTYEAA